MVPTQEKCQFVVFIKYSNFFNFFPDSTLPDGRFANIAFFSLLIGMIEESPDRHVIHDLPAMIEDCGLIVPEQLSSFRCFIRRSVDRAFSKKQFGLLAAIPPHVQPRVIGQLCDTAGITEDWLFNSEARYNGQATITIGLLLELVALKKRKGVTDVKCAEWVQRLFDLDYIPYHATINRQWGRIAEHASALRCKKDKQVAYLRQPYLPPSKMKAQQNPDMDNNNPLHEGFIQSGDFCAVSNSCTGVTSKTVAVNVDLTVGQTNNHPPSLKVLAQKAFNNGFDFMINEKVKQLSELYSQVKTIKDSLEEANKSLGKVNRRVGHYNPVNTYKRDQRAKATRDKLVECEKEIKQLKEKITCLSQKKDNALKLASKWQIKAKKSGHPKSCETSDDDTLELNIISERIRDLEWQNVQLMDTVSTGSAPCDAVTDSAQCVKTKMLREDGHTVYSDQVQMVYMQLLSLGVSVRKCSEVVRTVIDGLTDKKLDQLPSKATISGLQSECETLGQIHVANVMLNNANLTLHLDGTKKKFKEYGSFQVSVDTSDKSDENAATTHMTGGDPIRETLSVGIQEMSKGDADSFLTTFNTICQDLAETFTDDKDRIGVIHSQLVGAIKNLMTDRHVVNKSFKEKLQDARKELFEKYLEGYDTLSKDEQKKMTDLHGLFCGLHVLSNMGTAAGKALVVFEEIALPEGVKISDSAFQKGNSRTFDLIFELSQSMTVGGSQRTGRFADWDAYLKENGKTNRLVSFLRYRFNVLFTNGAGAYFHREAIKEFLKHEKLNKMLNCIVDSFNSPVCISSLRALGIFGALVTQPLWRVVERLE